VGVSEAEAQILTNLFEAAVVNTRAFEVIEQSQADNILEAQEYSLGGCTDETCAVEIGKLLAAENIILGTVSKLGAKFIVTAKIIDVTSGKNIRADSVEGMAIGDMSEQVNVLALLLADIPAASGGGQTGAGTARTGILGELFISTVPEGALILINGVEKGTSPALVSGLIPGVVVGSLRETKINGRGEARLPEDKYNVIVSGEYYKTLKTGFSVMEGITTDFRPELEFAETEEAAAYRAGI